GRSVPSVPGKGVTSVAGPAGAAAGRVAPASASIPPAASTLLSTKAKAKKAQASSGAEAALRAKIGPRAPFYGVVLGVDPSLRGTGLAVVRFSPQEQPRLLFSTTVKNRPALTPAQCLGAIASAVTAAIETYRPTCVALEQTVYV